jgi:hypothetical protein
MEAVLNLIWLIVALAGVWVWRFRWARSRQNSNRWAPTECVAIVCALALLFPVISLSDDLHPESLAVDSSTGKRNGSQLLARSLQPHEPGKIAKAHLGVAVLPARAASPVPAITNHLTGLASSEPVVRTSIVSGRSPPLFL